MKYVFKNKFLAVFFAIFDTLGCIVFLALRFKRAPAAPKKLLVVRLDHIGDFISTSPLLRLLKERFPHAHVTVAVNPALAQFAQTYPYVDALIAFEAPWLKRPKVKAGLRDIKEFARKIKEGGFDIAIDPRGDFFSICALALAGISFRVGYGITGGGFLLHREPKFDRAAGVVERNVGVLSWLGAIGAPHLPDVFFSQADKDKVEKLLSSLKVADAKAVVLHPFAGTLAKQWPPNNFQELIDVLQRKGRTVFVIGTKKDTCGLRNSVDLRGQLSLNELAFLIKRAGLFIGLDSGPAHIAIATETASVIICSGTNRPELWLPRALSARLAFHNVSCKPCGLTTCPKPKHYCMEAVSVEEVVMKISELKG